jgi:hypothetical protein
VKRIIAKLFMFLLLGAVVNVAVAWWGAVRSRGPASSEVLMSSEVSTDLWKRSMPMGWPTGDMRATYYEYGSLRTYVTWLFVSPHDSRSIVVYEAGFPLKSMYGAKHLISGRSLTYDGLIDVLGEPVPVYPHAFGFAINTVFYAAIIWLLFAAPGRVRRWRRIRRGLCAKCAYPVGASEVCTECGTALRAWLKN